MNIQWILSSIYINIWEDVCFRPKIITTINHKTKTKSYIEIIPLKYFKFNDFLNIDHIKMLKLE